MTAIIEAKGLAVRTEPPRGEALWPVMRQALVGRTEELALLDAMEAEHAALGPLLEAIDDALRRGESAPVARADLAARLQEHITHEEEDALPVPKPAQLAYRNEWQP